MENSNEQVNSQAEVFTVDPQDAEQNKVMGILAYIGLLCLVPIFAAKESKFAQFHANQGLVLAIAEIASSVVFGSILSRIPYIGWLFGIVGWGVSVAALVFAVMGIVDVCGGKAKALPIIGTIKILK